MDTHDDGFAAALDARIVELISKNKIKIPPYPAAATKLNTLINSDNYTLRDLAKIIAADQVLAAAVLRYANSPLLRPGVPITSLDVAVGRIGTDGTVRLAFAVGVGAAARKPGPLMSFRAMIWRQSLLSGEFCRMMATRFGLKPDEAFTCGLLHDFGKVIALVCIEEITAAANDRSIRLSRERCLTVMEDYHVELGMVMAAKWNLSEVITEVISSHHSSLKDPSPITQLMIASDHVVALLDSKPSVTETDLLNIPYLGGTVDTASMASALRSLPAIIQSFDTQDTAPAKSSRRSQKGGHATLVATPETTLGEPRYQVDFEVRPHADGATYRALFITDTGFALTSAVQIPDQSVVRMLLQCEPKAIDIWGTVTLCVAEGKGYRIEIKPLALDGQARELWMRLLSGLRGDAAKAL